ncbi:DUF2079 domain-containing protein [archaeon]|nr:DUF2079 domain-containing protein [archaeon]
MIKNLKTNRKDWIMLAIIMICFFLFWFISSMVLQHNFHTIYEIGYVEQALWNTNEGNFFYSISNSGNHFANHNSPILFLMLPFYYLFTSIFTIFFFCNVAIILGTIPIFKIAKEKLNSRTAGFIFAISYLMYPTFFYSNLRSFHPIMLSVPFIAFALYFMHKKDWTKTTIFLVIAMMTNETISLLVIMFGIFIFLKKKSPKKVGMILVIIGILWFLISTKAIIPSFSQGENYRFIGGLYGHLGSSASEIVSTIIVDPGYAFSYGSPDTKVEYLKILFKHNIFLSILSPEILFLTIPVFLQNLLSSSGYKYSYVAHYTYPIIPILLFAAIIGTRRISNWITLLFRINYRNVLRIILILLLISSIFSWIASGITPTIKENCYLFDNVYQEGKCPVSYDIIGNSPKENYPFIKDIISQIPDDSSVMAQNHLFSQLTQREETYRTNIYSQCSYAEYFILDMKGNIEGIDNFEEYLSDIVPNIGYELLEQHKNVYLFKRIGEERCY